MPLSIPGIISGITMVFVPSLRHLYTDLLGGRSFWSEMLQNLNRNKRNAYSGLSRFVHHCMAWLPNTINGEGNTFWSNQPQKSALWSFSRSFCSCYTPHYHLMVLSLINNTKHVPNGTVLQENGIVAFQTKTSWMRFIQHHRLSSALIATWRGTAASASRQCTKARKITSRSPNIPMLNADNRNFSHAPFITSVGLHLIWLAYTFNIPYVIRCHA